MSRVTSKHPSPSRTGGVEAPSAAPARSTARRAPEGDGGTRARYHRDTFEAQSKHRHHKSHGPIAHASGNGSPIDGSHIKANGVINTPAGAPTATVQGTAIATVTVTVAGTK
jgi:hypothetical protein